MDMVHCHDTFCVSCTYLFIFFGGLGAHDKLLDGGSSIREAPVCGYGVLP